MPYQMSSSPVKWSKPQSDHSRPSLREVNIRSYTSIPLRHQGELFNYTRPNLSLYLSIFVERLFGPLKAKLNPIWHLLALLGGRHILHVSWIRVTVASVDAV